MNRSIRRVGVVLMAAFLVLFVQLNMIQVFRAEDYTSNPANTLGVQRDFNRDRGFIVSADGRVVAETVAVPDSLDERFTRERRYPLGALMAPVTGYLSFLYGATGVEAAYNDELVGSTFGQQLAGWRDLALDRPTVGDVQLSVHAGLQQVAADSLGARPGSVVALDPRTGQILALWSYPSYDPNLLSTIDLNASMVAWDALNAEAGQPLSSHAYQQRYAPGSTFKVVTGGIGLRTGTVTAAEPVYPVESAWVPPLTERPITNFGGSSCGGNLQEILVVSCNTAFARMAVETIGPDDMVDGVRQFGFNEDLPVDLPGAVRSAFPTDFTEDLPRLAQASIGQNDVQATPLLMAMVAGAVGNGGTMMTPRVVSAITNRSGSEVSRPNAEVWRTPLDPADNQVMRDDMVAVVERGTAVGMGLPGVQVGAKTGTAQLDTDPPSQHTWMVAFAGPPGEAHVAVAVVVLDQTGGASGGGVAGPVARTVLEAALAVVDAS